VWGPKKFMGKTYDGIHRTSFLFDVNGILVKVIEKPNTKNHAEEIINFFKENK
jgi:peroxiredoxin Q/BCP